ncbi:MAG: hypothetical protein ACYS5F_15785 [Planctomycetota bacterium]|jgi:hypothetical protein
MKILTTSASEQNITVIPRQFQSTYTLKVRDEAANTEIFNDTVSASSATNKRIVGVTFNPVLKEGRTYTMTLLYADEVVYRDKIFCTDQTVNHVQIKRSINLQTITMILMTGNMITMILQAHTITII